MMSTRNDESMDGRKRASSSLGESLRESPATVRESPRANVFSSPAQAARRRKDALTSGAAARCGSLLRTLIVSNVAPRHGVVLPVACKYFLNKEFFPRKCRSGKISQNRASAAALAES
jgi:hypothetical protein